MPCLDASGEKILVRVVYDGPALAGKTTNVEHLQGLFREEPCSELVSPGAVTKRTIFLDWFRVDTGFAAGHPLSCQFLTVPGQLVLSRRRELLLSLADAVVFVASAEPESRAELRASYASLLRILAERAAPPPVVLQLNKTDVSGAMSATQLRELLELPSGSDVHQAQADVGRGVKETALAALHLAADAAQDFVLRNGIAALTRDERGAEDLRRDILQHEREDGRTPLQVMIDARALDELPSESWGRPRAVVQSGEPFRAGGPPLDGALEEAAPPGCTIASGLIWPANTGRSLLQRAAGEEGWERSVKEGILLVQGALWSFTSDFSQSHATLDEARQALLRRAREAVALGAVRVPRLAWCVAAAPGERYLLWRLGADPASVSEHLEIALREARLEEAWALLEGYLDAVQEVQERLGSEAPCGVQDFAWYDGRVLALQRVGAPEGVSLGLSLRPAHQAALPPPLEQSYAAAVEARFGSAVCEQMRRAS